MCCLALLGPALPSMGTEVAGRESESSYIDALSNRLWADPWLRAKRIERTLKAWEFRSLALAEAALASDDHERALRVLERATAMPKRMSHRATVAVYRFLHQLAEKHASAGEADLAAEAYRESLMLGAYLPDEYTANALNQLISTYFEMREYAVALMFVRIGVTVLDDVGGAPYLAMNRIIEEMASLGDALEDFESDFDAAMDRLAAAAAAAEQQGLAIEDQWWAPVYEARDDRERAIALLKDILAWQPEDAMRAAASDEDAAALSP